MTLSKKTFRETPDSDCGNSVIKKKEKSEKI